MNTKFLILAALCVSTLTLVDAQHNQHGQTVAPSPYAKQLDSPVRGLSAQEVEDLIAGNGAGYARTAELNGYPGPSHLLQLQEQLGLTAEQITAITRIYDDMKVEAQRLGQEIVEAEKRFSQSFAEKNSTPQAVQAQSAELGGLYSELRAVHLMAHLEVKPLLSSKQIAHYNTLRGYTQ